MQGDKTVAWDNIMYGREAWTIALNGSVDGKAAWWDGVWMEGQCGWDSSMDSSAYRTVA